MLSKQASFNRAHGLRVSVKVNSAGLKQLFVTQEEDTQKARLPRQSKCAFEKLSDINTLTHTCLGVRVCASIQQTQMLIYAARYCVLMCVSRI